MLLSVAGDSVSYSAMRKTFISGFALGSLVFLGMGPQLYAGVTIQEMEREVGKESEKDADDVEGKPSEWSFKVAPYAWLAGTGGAIVTDGVKTDFDLEFKDIFDATTGGFQLNLEARYGRFFAEFDGTWAKIAHSDDLLRGNLDLDIEQTIIELRAGYRLIGPEFRKPTPETRPYIPGNTVLDVYVGARYWLTDIDVEINFPGRPPLIPSSRISVHDTDEWIEPLVGGRLGIGLTSKTALLIDGNIGGFGVGDAVDLTWTVGAFINWRFGSNSSVALGWRAQGVEEYSGTGSNRNGSEFVTTGPLIGYVYSF